MNAGFLHLQTVFVILAALSVICATAFAQRLYFRIRTQRVEAVETMILRFSDWLTVGAALLFGWLAIAAFFAWQDHSDWLDARRGAIARTIEVGNIDSKGATTLVVYRGDQAISEERQEIVVSKTPEFWVEVQFVRFSGLLHWFGQGDALSIGSVNAERPRTKASGTNWPWIRPHEFVRLESPKDIASGDIFEVIVNAHGSLEIRKRSE